MNNAKEQINFTIIIPTCDRVETLEPVLKSLVNLNYTNYKILVSDNFSTDNTKVFVQELQKTVPDKIEYIRTLKRLSMPDHWDFAFSHAKGDYIIIGGDDDFISPNTLSIANDIILEHNVDLLSWLAGLYYFPGWKLSNKQPGVSEVGNVIHSPNRTTDNLYKVQQKKILNNVANFNWYGFPNFCNFTFKRSLGQKIIDDTGRLFWPSAPDYTASLLLMINAQNPHFKERCMSFGGRSKNSNYHSILTRGEDKRLDDFVSEFEEQDLWPYHQPKLQSYWNYLIAPLALARTFYPNVMKDIDLNKEKFCQLTFSEHYSKYGRIAAWDDGSLIERWIEHFKDIGLSEAQIFDISESVKLACKNEKAQFLDLTQVGVLELSKMGIHSLVDLSNKFTQVEKLICRVSDRVHSNWPYRHIFNKINQGKNLS